MRTSLDKHYILAASATAFHLRFVSGPSRPDTHPQAPTRRAWEELTQTQLYTRCGSLPEKLRDQGVQGAQPSGPPTQPSRPRLDEANEPRTQPRMSPSTPQKKSPRGLKHRTERRGPRQHRHASIHRAHWHAVPRAARAPSLVHPRVLLLAPLFRPVLSGPAPFFQAHPPSALSGWYLVGSLAGPFFTAH